MVLFIIQITFISLYLFEFYVEVADTGVTQTAGDFTCVGFARYISQFTGNALRRRAAA